LLKTKVWFAIINTSHVTNKVTVVNLQAYRLERLSDSLVTILFVHDRVDWDQASLWSQSTRSRTNKI